MNATGMRDIWPETALAAIFGGKGGIWAALALAALLIAPGCAQRTPPPLELVPASLLEKEPPPASPESALENQPDDVQTAVQEYARTHDAPILHRGVTTIFPYDPDGQPTVECKPLRVTEIALAPGEAAQSVAAGDTERWIVTPAAGRALIKPKAPGIATNLIILANRHNYSLALKSGRHYMPQAAFYYPREALAAERARQREVARAARQAAYPPPLAKLNFGYTVPGPDVPWKPVQAFDDGSHVFIELPGNLMAADAPSLMVAANGNPSLVNYQVVNGRYYQVDRLFNQAILVSGAGGGRREVRITRNQPAGS